MNIQNTAPLHHAPQRVRPPFNVAEDVTLRGQTTSPEPDEWRTDRVAALLEALDGIELGKHDRRIIAWLADWEIETVGTIVSWLYRARAGADVCGGAR